MIFNPNVMAAAGGGGGGAVAMTYKGDGNASRTFTFDNIEPAMIFIMVPEVGEARAMTTGSNSWCYGFLYNSTPFKTFDADVTFSGNLVTFSGLTASKLSVLNKSGSTYLLVAIPKA